MIDPTENDRRRANHKELREAVGKRWATKTGSTNIRNIRRREAQRLALLTSNKLGGQGWSEVRRRFEFVRKSSRALVAFLGDRLFDYAFAAIARQGLIERLDDGPRLTALGIEALADPKAPQKEHVRHHLADLLADYMPGTWVILSPNMSTVIAAADTPEEAMEKAGISPVTSDNAVGKRPMMMQVPDPKMAFYGTATLAGSQVEQKGTRT